MYRRAFTFIEVMVVVAVLGLIAGGSAWMMAEQARESATEDAIGRVIHADRLTRQAAMRLGRNYVLRFDIDARKVLRFGSDKAKEDGVSHTLKLPSSCRIDDVRLIKSGESGGHRLMKISSGRAEIAFGDTGRSASYVVCFESRNGDKRKWLIICGLSGQAIVSDDEDQAENLFSKLARGGHDLD